MRHEPIYDCYKQLEGSMMKLWRWEKGRLNSGYRKFTLFYSTVLGMDAYILHIPRGVDIPHHYDPVPGFEHHRINITIAGCLIMRTRPWKHESVKRFGLWFSYFRPDTILHWAPPPSRDTYVVSFGWLRKTHRSPVK